jgi:SAM-dependent methyltransferase
MAQPAQSDRFAKQEIQFGDKPESGRPLDKKRWTNYSESQSTFPLARRRELTKTLELADPRPGEKIWEVGTGSAIFTRPLAKAVGPKGSVITTDVFDAQPKLDPELPITPVVLSPDKPLLEGKQYKDSFDKITSIATFHHLDNRDEGTGEKGRRKAFNVFYDNLKPGGKLVITDVLDDTRTQAYFDAIDDPVLCAPAGHPHDFFTKERLTEVAQEAGFKNVQVRKLFVPWQFKTPEEAQKFTHLLHNAQCSIDESFAVAKKHLGFQQVKDHFELGWELFFLTAEKPEDKG